jgi:hypothetical protein
MLKQAAATELLTHGLIESGLSIVYWKLGLA